MDYNMYVLSLYPKQFEIGTLIVSYFDIHAESECVKNPVIDHIICVSVLGYRIQAEWNTCTTHIDKGEHYKLWFVVCSTPRQYLDQCFIKFCQLCAHEQISVEFKPKYKHYLRRINS